MNETIEFWGLPLSVWGVLGAWFAGLGAWFAGISAFRAVRTSLRLARDQNKVQLRIKIMGVCLENVNGGPYEDAGCRINVLNNGTMPVHISRIGWLAGANKVISFDTINKDNEIPKTLNRGDCIEYFLAAIALPPNVNIRDDKSAMPLYVAVQTASTDLFDEEVEFQMVEELMSKHRISYGEKS